MSYRHRGPRTICFYGVSGDTKSSQCYHAIRYYHRKSGCVAQHIRDCPGVRECPGKIVRYINVDPGQSFESVDDAGMIDKGIVDYIDFSDSKLALADSRKLALGYWPNENGDLRAEERFRAEPEEWGANGGKIGAYVIEGITSMTDMWLGHMRRQAQSEKVGVGFKPSWYYEEDEEVFTGLQEGHYQLPQNEFREQHTGGYRKLPIEFLVWTAHVGKGLDKERGEECYCPKGAGQADNFKIPSWFGDCIHLSRKVFTSRDKEGGPVAEERVVAWFKNHPDEVGTMYLAKPRLAPEKYPLLLEVFPAGYVPMDYKNGILKYMLAVDMIREGKTAGEVRGRLGMGNKERSK